MGIYLFYIMGHISNSSQRRNLLLLFGQKVVSKNMINSSVPTTMSVSSMAVTIELSLSYSMFLQTCFLYFAMIMIELISFQN